MNVNFYDCKCGHCEPCKRRTATVALADRIECKALQIATEKARQAKVSRGQRINDAATVTVTTSPVSGLQEMLTPDEVEPKADYESRMVPQGSQKQKSITQLQADTAQARQRKIEKARGMNNLSGSKALSRAAGYRTNATA